MQIVSTPNPTLDAYYAALSNYARLGVTHEQGIRSAFRGLLESFAKPVGWTLVEEHALPGSRKRPDGTLLDSFQIPRGYWEAKDAKDDLDAEIRKKIKLGYDLCNTFSRTPAAPSSTRTSSASWRPTSPGGTRWPTC